MKRLIFGFVDAVVILFLLTTGAHAAPEAATSGRIGPYEGAFQGVAYGDKGSRAPLDLELTHRGNQVEGEVSLGEGLYVDGGFCGAVHLPAVSQHVEGQTSTWNPKRLRVSPTFDVGGLRLTVDFESTLSASGNVLTAKAKVDLPWFCGRDPVLGATMYRD